MHKTIFFLSSFRQPIDMIQKHGSDKASLPERIDGG